MAPDSTTVANAKLEGDWSALEFSQELTAGAIEALTASLDKLEPLPRVRLLLAALLLPRAKREELREPLQVLAACLMRACWPATGTAQLRLDGHAARHAQALFRVAATDREEQVHLTARMASVVDGQLDLEQAISNSNSVQPWPLRNSGSVREQH